MVVTGKQLAMLRAIDKTTRLTGYAPTLREIQKQLRAQSVSTIKARVDLLATMGLLESVVGKSRSVRLTPEARLLLAHPQVAGLYEPAVSRVKYRTLAVESVQLKDGGELNGRTAAAAA